MSAITPVTLDSSLLLNYYSAQLSAATASKTSSAGSTSSSASNSSGLSSGTSSNTTSFGKSASSSSSETPPWEVANTETAQEETAQILSTTDFIQQSTTPLVATSGSSAKTDADNQKLFTLYQAVSKLSQLAGIATQSGLTSGELAGYNTQFQTGLQQIQSYIGSTTFNNLTLQAQNPSASVTSTATVPLGSFDYQGSTIVSDANYNTALPGISASDSFNIAVTAGGTTTNVPIDLSQVQGGLTIGNIVNYVNQQLKADGFNSTFSAQITSGSINNIQDASYGISVTPAPGESISLSSAAATPALYLSGTSGSTTGTPANSETGQPAVSPDNQGRITALTNLSGSPQTLFNATEAPSSGTTTAQSTVVDSQGNVYVVGNATGNMGGQINQGTQDVYLSKYDSAGNLQWSTLLGSAGSASAYSLALNPQGGVVVAGSTTAEVNTSAISNGNTDSFVASYDTNGNQVWTQQIPTLNNNQANAVTVDQNGNVYIGGSVTGGAIGAGQTSTGGTNAYLAELNNQGQIVSEQQYGATGNDSVSQMATLSDGSVVVASVQNGDAVLSKYASGDITGSPVWQMDLGSLNGGAINGIAVNGSQIYLSGTTSNGALTASGQATVTTASNGSTNAFVFNATDNGTSATADTVSYVAPPGGASSGGGLTIGPDGTVYLAGTTTGTFSGQSRNVTGVNNAFVAALATNGSIDWTRQFGGADGQSTGTGVAINPTGSSVLNALGLPSGTVSVNQSVDLTSQTTLRAGDTFQLETEGTGGRTSTITISQGESLQDLADSINSELLSAGKATVTYSTTGGQALKITASAGNTINLIAGPADSDALGRLGISPGTITAPAKSSSSSKSSTSSASTTPTTTSFGIKPSSQSSSASTAKQVYGLNLDTTIDLLSSSDASVAKISLQNVMTAITNIYQKTNTSSSSSSSTASSSTSIGTAPAYLQAEVASDSLALQSFSATNSLASTSSSSSSTTTYGLPASLLQTIATA